MKRHVHEALYDEFGKLTRICSACGRDLSDDIHFRVSERNAAGNEKA
jgi:hypothetical protein